MLRDRHEMGLHALACDEQASAHYAADTKGLIGWLWRIRCYGKGFMGM